jgi:hypothetical protein
MSTLFGMAVLDALLEEVDRERPDILVVDYQLRGALSADRGGVGSAGTKNGAGATSRPTEACRGPGEPRRSSL